MDLGISGRVAIVTGGEEAAALAFPCRKRPSVFTGENLRVGGVGAPTVAA